MLTSNRFRPSLARCGLVAVAWNLTGFSWSLILSAAATPTPNLLKNKEILGRSPTASRSGPPRSRSPCFRQDAGYARFAYNWAVGEFQAGLQVGEWLSERSLRPRWNVVKAVIAPWGKGLSQNAAKYAVINFGKAASGWGGVPPEAEDRNPLPAGGIPQVSGGASTSRASGRTTARTPSGPAARRSYFPRSGAWRWWSI